MTYLGGIVGDEDDLHEELVSAMRNAIYNKIIGQRFESVLCNQDPPKLLSYRLAEPVTKIEIDWSKWK